MRKLTVKRKWSMIECASRIYLYVQCAERNATHSFDGKHFMQYRLKNGKAVELDILDDPTIIIIESSTMSVTYTVPEGSTDITLLAKPHYAPFSGNPFTIEPIE